MKQFHLGGFTLLLFISLEVQCQIPSTLDQQTVMLTDMSRQIAQRTLEEFIKNNPGKPIPGELLAALLPMAEGECETAPASAPRQQWQEIVMVASVNSARPELQSGPVRHLYHAEEGLQRLSQIPYGSFSQGLSNSAIHARARELWQAGGHKGEFDPRSQIGRELFIEGLVQAIPKSTLSEAELTKKVASIIADSYPASDRAERLRVLSDLSQRLYLNYSREPDAGRNPWQNTNSANPNYNTVPNRDMSFQQIFSAAAQFNRYGGGVCNDITENVAVIAQHLFPKEDVLILNHGSHFGVMITDGKQHTVVDSWEISQMQGTMTLNPKFAATQVRLLRVQQEKGQYITKQMAQVDTQMGQLIALATENERPLLMTSEELSKVVMLHYRQVEEKNKNRQVSTTLSAGAANLPGTMGDSSQVIVVFARRNWAGDKMSATLGSGASTQRFQNGEATYQLHFHADLKINFLHYLHPEGRINTAVGVLTHETQLQLSGMITPKVENGIVDYSVMPSINNQVQLESKLGSTTASIQHVLGIANAGDLSGAASQGNIRGMLSSQQWMFNQANAEFISAPIAVLKGGQAVVNYQGSAIGQTLDVGAMIKLEARNGAQLSLMSGYTKGFGGLGAQGTQHNLSIRPMGLHGGVEYDNGRGQNLHMGLKGNGRELELGGSFNLKSKKGPVRPKR